MCYNKSKNTHDSDTDTKKRTPSISKLVYMHIDLLHVSAYYTAIFADPCSRAV
jgi:hypothetical protein